MRNLLNRAIQYNVTSTQYIVLNVSQIAHILENFLYELTLLHKYMRSCMLCAFSEPNIFHNFRTYYETCCFGLYYAVINKQEVLFGAISCQDCSHLMRKE